MAENVFMAWSFLDYLNERWDNEIHKWLNSNAVPKNAKAKINARLFNLQGFRVWPEQYVSAYKGWDEIIELKAVYGNVEYRLLGFYGPRRWEFTLLNGGIEKGKLPRALLEVADERRGIVLANRLRTKPHDFS
jgi:hypothetical protein